MRCRLRKQLFIKRNKICEISLAFGLAGLIFVIIDSEITAAIGGNDFSKVMLNEIFRASEISSLAQTYRRVSLIIIST